MSLRSQVLNQRFYPGLFVAVAVAAVFAACAPRTESSATTRTLTGDRLVSASADTSDPVSTTDVDKEKDRIAP